MNQEDHIVRVWDEASEAWMSFVREGKDYYRDELNNPATFKLVGDIKGERVLDLACGEGYNTRILAKKGAKVTGIDFSQKIIEKAREKEAEQNLGITYIVSDAADLKALPSNSFDMVTCFMSMQDIEHYEKATYEVARVLKNNGRFIFSIPHPCFEKIVKDTEGWRVRNKSSAEDEKEKEPEMGSYFNNVRYEIHWTMERLTQPFKTTSFHRTLSDYSQALHQNGFLISRLIEPRPEKEAIRKHFPLKEVSRTPQSIIFEAVKMQDSPVQ